MSFRLPFNKLPLCEIIVEYHIDRGEWRQAIAMESMDRHIIVKDQIGESPRMGLFKRRT